MRKRHRSEGPSPALRPIVVTLCCVSCLGLLLTAFLRRCDSKIPTIRASVERVSAYTGSPVIWGSAEVLEIADGVPGLQVVPASENAVLEGLTALEACVHRYPRCFWESVPLHAFVLVGRISYGEERVCGCYSARREAIVLNVAGSRCVNPEAGSAIFDHEVFHALHAGSRQRLRDFLEWRNTNHRGWKYVGRRGPRDPQLRFPDSHLPGFVNMYAMVSAKEDMAEVFAHWIADRELLLGVAHEKGDLVLQRKVALMDSILSRTCIAVKTDEGGTSLPVRE